MALTLLVKAFPKTLLPMVPSTRPSRRPLRFLPSYDDDVNVCGAVGLTRKCVGVARSASPDVRVGRGEDDVVRIGPVVVQSFPDASRTFGDVGLCAATLMHVEVLVGAVAEELRTVGPEVGEPADVLLRCQPGYLVEMDRGHVSLLFCVEHYLS